MSASMAADVGGMTGDVFSSMALAFLVDVPRRSSLSLIIKMNDCLFEGTGASTGDAVRCDSAMALAPVVSISMGMLSGSKNARMLRRWQASGACFSRSWS